MSGRVESVTEGALEIAGECALHHGGSLRDVRLAWRLTGAADAPLDLRDGRRLVRPAPV